MLGLLDFSAAFDRVDHDVLAESLSRTYGVHSTALDWLCSYLCDRRQTILFDGVFSTVRSLRYGVPQGSVLRPQLFLLYTAVLAEFAESLGLSSHLYDNDYQLYTWRPLSTFVQQRRRMELGVEPIVEWVLCNRLRHLVTAELSVCEASIRTVELNLLYTCIHDLIVADKEVAGIQTRFSDWQWSLESKGLKINTRKTETKVCAKTNSTLMIRDRAGHLLKQIEIFKI